MKRGPYDVTSSEIKYKNTWATFREDRVIRPDGKKGLYSVVTYAPGVMVAALDENNQLYLVQEYQYAIDRETPCLPGGGLDPGEIPLEAAQRELREEAGITAQEWIAIGTVEPFPMTVEGTQYLFLARGLTIANEHEPEFALLQVSFDEAVKMVMDGEVTHAASCVGILKTALLMASEH